MIEEGSFVCPQCQLMISVRQRASAHQLPERQERLSASPEVPLFPHGPRPRSQQGIIHSNHLISDSSVATGITLQNKYQLMKKQGFLQWSAGSRETWWLAQDVSSLERPVSINEVMLFDYEPARIAAILYTARHAFQSRLFTAHSQMPKLLDVFEERERYFFVFEVLDGESFLTRLRSMNYQRREQEVIECCLQICELLGSLAQHAFLHGCICPDSLVFRPHAHPSWALTNFSVLIAGKGRPLFLDASFIQRSAYMAPEIAQGLIDTRSDLYALLATAYHGATGIAPQRGNAADQQMHIPLSPHFQAVVVKGLAYRADQRYRSPHELQHDLRALSTAKETLSSVPPEVFLPTQTTSLSHPFDDLFAMNPKTLHPRPEELPFLEPQRYAVFASGSWLLGIFLLLSLLVLFSQAYVHLP
jgi:serine/threonine protein kinase